jgi:uncharacterized protein YuzE
MIQVSYDKLVDAAYIWLRQIGKGEVKKVYPCPPDEVGGMINLDFDAEGRLVGVEVLDASRYLPKELLAIARSPDGANPHDK